LALSRKFLVEPIGIVKVQRHAFGGFREEGVWGVSDSDAMPRASSAFTVILIGLFHHIVQSTEEDIGGMQTKVEFLDNVYIPVRIVLVVAVGLQRLDDVEVSLGEVVVNGKFVPLLSEL
jgi:hypothetical protein